MAYPSRGTGVGRHSKNLKKMHEFFEHDFFAEQEKKLNCKKITIEISMRTIAKTATKATATKVFILD